jgi:hypothetical protein
MAIEVDHAFIACQPGAPEADALLRHGFVEGSPNTHPGQGTANRRFFFENFMLELLWIASEAEATSERTRRTRLWERCADPQTAASPFGILFRPDAEKTPPPFPTWPYCPAYLPAGLAIEFAAGTTLQEPELIYLPFVRGPRLTTEPATHRLPFQRLRSLAVGVRHPAALSDAALATQRLGQLGYFPADRPVLELSFEGSAAAQLDLRPLLPLVLRADLPAQ